MADLKTMLQLNTEVKEGTIAIREIGDTQYMVMAFEYHGDDPLKKSPTEKQLKAGATWEMERLIDGLWNIKKKFPTSNGEVEYTVTVSVSRFTGDRDEPVDVG